MAAGLARLHGVEVVLAGQCCGRFSRQWLGGTRDTRGDGEDQDAEEASRRVASVGTAGRPPGLSLVGGFRGNVQRQWAQGAMWPDFVEFSENMLYLPGGKAKVQFADKFLDR